MTEQRLVSSLSGVCFLLKPPTAGKALDDRTQERQQGEMCLNFCV